MNIPKYVPHFFSDLGEIRYKVSEQNAVDRLWVFLKIGAGKAALSLWASVNSHLRVL